MIDRLIAAAARQKKSDKGFSLIELLVVVVIIGILAAIAIPIFLNQRQGAWRASVESDVANARLAVETALTHTNGSLSGITLPTSGTAPQGTVVTTTPVSSTPFTVSPNVTVNITTSGTGYEITGTHSELTGESYAFNSTTGVSDW